MLGSVALCCIFFSMLFLCQSQVLLLLTNHLANQNCEKNEAFRFCSAEFHSGCWFSWEDSFAAASVRPTDFCNRIKAPIWQWNAGGAVKIRHISAESLFSFCTCFIAALQSWPVEDIPISWIFASRFPPLTVKYIYMKLDFPSFLL